MTTSDVIQFATLGVLTITLAILAYQSYSNVLTLRVATTTARLDSYLSITAKITQDDVDTMLLHLADIDFDRIPSRTLRVKSYIPFLP